MIANGFFSISLWIFMCFLILFAVFVLIVTPYLIGAIYFARITVREFERLADAREEKKSHAL